MKNLYSIRIEGRCFPAQTTLELFPNERHRVSFVFGRNGSGKSTLASSFEGKKSGLRPSGITSFALQDKNNCVLANEADLLAKTYVFDEGFVEEKVRVSTDGLDAIVMLGDAGELTDQISKKEEELSNIKSKIDSTQESALAYSDRNNPTSSSYHDSQIRISLGSATGWASREKEIRGLTRNASVTDNVVNSIIAMELPEQTGEEIAESLKEGLSRLGSLKSGEPLPDAPTIPEWVELLSEDAIRSALAKEIEKPELSEREKRIFDVVEKFGANQVHHAVEYFENPTADYCPFCLRDISPGEKDSLRETVEKALNAAADEHKEDLSALKCQPLTLDYLQFESTFSDLARACSSAFDELAAGIAECNERIDSKLNNLYKPIDLKPVNLGKRINKLKLATTELQKAISAWNKDIKNTAALQAKLEKENRVLARIEIDQSLIQRNKADAERNQLNIETQSLESARRNAEAELSQLESMKSNINVALEDINDGLAFIFLDRDRLVLQGDKGVYSLYANGSKVKPSDISAGERNAIALCYFFTLIGEEKSRATAFSDEMLIVIDDPISSFDQENRIGILSYLRSQIRRAIVGNPDTKVLCLTHDGYSMNAFAKMSKELVNASKRAGEPYAIKFPDVFTLSEGELTKWELNNTRYSELLKTVYEYSVSPSPSLRPYIGNAARKMLEAFSTFEFGLGISEFADSPTVLEKLSPEATKDYFSSLLFNMVIHSESHMADPVKIEGIIETGSEYSAASLDRIVRDTVCLLYCLNKNHVLTHLSEHDDADIVISSWVEEISRLSTQS